MAKSRSRLISTMIVVVSISLGVGIFVFASYKAKLQTLKQYESLNAEFASSALAPTSECDVDAELLIDISGSMSQVDLNSRRKLDWAKEASNAFISEMEYAARNTNNQIRVGVSTFGMQYSQPYNSGKIRQPLTSNYAAARTAINLLTTTSQNGFGTCIDCGLRAANGDIMNNVVDPLRQRIVVLISDGYGNRNFINANNRVGLTAARTASTATANTGRNSNIKYYVVGYGGNGAAYDGQTLAAIANDPDVEYYAYRPNVSDWLATFREIAANICEQPAMPDCTGLSSDKDLNNLVIGQPVNFYVTASGGSSVSPITNVEATVYDGVTCSNHVSSYDPVAISGPGTYLAETWTPSIPGPFTVYGRVWMGTTAECRADCVDGPPRIPCGSSSYCKLTGTVNNIPSPTPTRRPPTPTPSRPPTPTPRQACASVKIASIKDAPFGSPTSCNGEINLACNQDRVYSESYHYIIDYEDAQGVSQPQLQETGTISSVQGNYCATPPETGYSPELRLTRIPFNGTAKVTIEYAVGSNVKVLATNGYNPATGRYQIVIDNITAGQAVSTLGHVCFGTICNTSAPGAMTCESMTQREPQIIRVQSTSPCQ